MGIKKLSKFLLSHNIVNRYESFDNYVSQNVNLLQNNYIRICIDASLYIHKYTLFGRIDSGLAIDNGCLE